MIYRYRPVGHAISIFSNNFNRYSQVGGTYTRPIIVSPQIVIGAFGKIQKLPRFDEKGNVTAANVIFISWAADHRVIDGVTMAKYSNLWKHYIENPMFLLTGT